MAALWSYGFDCGYEARIKGQSHASTIDVVERYINIYIKPAAEADHSKNCTKCRS